MEKFQVRQGDVYVREVSEIPSGATLVKREAGRVILAHGEVTGHSHAIAAKDASLWAFGAERYLKVRRPVTLDHEEHDQIKLPAGNFKIVIQREYSPLEIRNVAD